MEDFNLVKRIYYHDTDWEGVVSYANYLKYLEEARTEYLLIKGIDLRELSRKGIWFAVARVQIKNRSPAHYQDTIRMLTRIEKTKMSAVLFSQQIFKDEVTIAEAGTTLICMGNDYKPIPLREEIKKPLLT